MTSGYTHLPASSGGGGGGGGGDVNLTGINGTAPAVNTGNATAGTQRVVLATNQPAVPVSAASLPLPSGAATETTLASIDGKTPTLVSSRVPVDGSGVTQPISAASLPLPTGAATETTLASINGKTPALVSGRQPVDGSGVTQPISAASLPLPTGAATSANQTTANSSLSSIDGKTPTLIDSKQPVIGSAYTSTVSFTRPTNTTAYTALDVIGINNAGSAGSAIHTFAAIGRTGGSIQITSADITIALTAIPSGMTSFRLHLYMASPTAILDNAAFSAASGDRTNYRGFIDFTVAAIGGGFLYATADYIGKALKLTTDSLFGVLVTNGGFTPTSGEAYQIILRSVELG